MLMNIRTNNGYESREINLDSVTQFEKFHSETYNIGGNNFKKWDAKYFVYVDGLRQRCSESDYKALKEAFGKAFFSDKKTKTAYKEVKGFYEERKATDWIHTRRHAV